MRDAFLRLTEQIHGALEPGERFTAWLAAESSDFVRFNHGKVRQAGHVTQRNLTVRLVQGEADAAGQKQAQATLSLAGDAQLDRLTVLAQVHELRRQLQDVAADPHLLLASDQQPLTLPADTPPLDAESMAIAIVQRAAPYDLVGILAAGTIATGFAASTGTRLWHQKRNFNFDWSLYAHGDKAVKCSYAGDVWDDQVFERKLAEAAHQLALLQRPPHTLAPGEYRTYLAPAALDSLLSMLNWGGFSEKQFRVKRSPLLKMLESGAQFSPLVDLVENTEEGLSPPFQAEGFVKPARVPLVAAGRLVGSLIAPRTAKEYGLAANADGDETTQSLHMAPGRLPTADVIARLGTGLYVSNLWYLNFSDRANAKVTGMTRFATFWVENGQMVAPLNVMRFDDSLFRILGDNLEALTVERTLLVDTDTYGERHTASSLVPGALLSKLALVL